MTGNSNIVYLDYNATAPLRPKATQIMADIMQVPHNASSVHRYGQQGRKIIENARNEIAALVGAPANQVVFNSGATEANNTVLAHFQEQKILISAIEHPSITEFCPDANTIPVTKDGAVDLTALEDKLKQNPKTALVSVMLVNNETGAIQPIQDISALTKRHGALLHCDAVQAVGRIPIDMTELSIDFMTLSSHKIGGPQGVGALILGLCGITPTLIHGGGQEKKARGGTENVAGIAGFGAAAQAAKNSIDDFQSLSKLRNKLETGLRNISPEIIIHSENAARVANTTFFSLPGISSERILMSLDLDKIAISNGSACSSGSVKPSPVLQAMGHKPEITSSALRISTGWNTSENDIDAFLQSWQTIYSRIKERTKSHA